LRRHALLKVPSAIMPKASNYLLNPGIPIRSAWRYSPPIATPSTAAFCG